ncbi:hypothetical protein B0G76_1336 [Paraburkholderia sp. BL23I1N1]|uniref:hypothetical protein n=1 Tax=Paraburkholderia sp. BL23I1N1 TaxID=1938802 RepID=UPI000FF75B34|nr:hypothetical protein [Paraburkholderia sp. BL23I1N1]RKE35275.1 hypothetical protein B0G76_1336 [Paraburkholderia sp. BL23I1N1]
MVDATRPGGSAMRWSEDEDEILREIWTLRTPLKVSAARLPGRSVRGIQMRAETLELPRRRQARGTSDTRPAFVALWSALKRRGTRIELATRAGVSNQTAGDFIKHFRAQMHIVDWYRPADGPTTPIYKAGAGVDKPKPPNKPRDKIYSDYWKRMKRERPDLAAARIARTTFKRLEREGKLMRRDPAAVALFGTAGGAQ